MNNDDRWEIGETLARAGHVIDGGHLDRLDEIFTPEVVYDLRDAGLGAFEGIEAIRTAVIRLGARNPLAHHLTNVMLEEDTDGQVTARSKGLVIMADGRLESVNHVDTLRRHDGRWRIGRRIITTQRAPVR
ncbi:nuclear transport factor 2 family protein [Actinoplanes bogorensis]|uniref:Nuclear transport factor 2 family protein n=1 Tax=Paractinoplanes bogorensis TaxID=1610840 RepID=A0ABS5YWL0_9ACTN|nr:nuclear transport factor 2 family protein [Actinoplanes bogorensis]MBU2667824.1 nuclear transport factor 2 family protein [Actinoplanes bogorensis]